MFWCPTTESLNSSPHAFRSSPAQMHATYDGMKWSIWSEVADVCQGIHHACMSAPEDDHQTGLGVYVKGLVINERIRTGAAGIQKEPTSGIFEKICPRDFSRDEESRQHFRRFRGPHNLPLGLA